MKKHNLIFSGIILLGFLSSTSVAAALIDNGIFTTDTSTGLDWLDLSATQGYSANQALSIYSSNNYRYANNSEVSGILSSFGITYNFVENEAVALYPPSQSSDKFVNYFGTTLIKNTGPASLGMFEVLGRTAYLCISNNVCGFGGNFVADFDISDGAPSAGVFLVRESTVIPVPAAVWLFISGLIAVAGFGKREETQ